MRSSKEMTSEKKEGREGEVSCEKTLVCEYGGDILRCWIVGCEGAGDCASTAALDRQEKSSRLAAGLAALLLPRPRAMAPTAGPSLQQLETED